MGEDQQRSYWTDPLTWAGNTGMFIFGVEMAILGAILPSLFRQIELAPAEAGSLFLFLNLGSFVMTVAGGPAFDRMGFKGILIICSFLSASSFCLMAGAPSYSVLAAGSFVLGLGGGGLNVGTNALVSDLHPSNQSVALNRLGIFFGLGTFFMPFFIGVLIETIGLSGVLFATAGFASIPGVLFLLLSFPASKQAQGFPIRKALSFLRKPIVLLLGILLFFQSGTEITTSGWLSTFVVSEVGASPANAAFYLSCFWGALVAGRFFSSWALSRVSAARLVQSSAALSVIFVFALVFYPGPYSSFLLAGLIGFSMAAIFPTILGEASARYPDFSGTVLGVLIGIALLGGMSAPYAAGLLVEDFGLKGAMILPALGFFMVLVMQSLVNWWDRDR